MKNNQLTTTTFQSNDIDLDEKMSKLKDELDTLHHQFLEKVPFDASSLAYSNLPPHDADKIEPYITKIKGFYSRLRNDIPQKVQGSLQLVYGAFDMTPLDEQLKKLEQQKIITEREKNHLKDELKQRPKPRDISQYKWTKVLLGFLAFFDVMSMIASFMGTFQENYLFAIVLGITIGLSLIYFTKSLVLHIRDTPQTKTSLAVKWASVILLLLISIFIGGLRYVQSTDDGTVHQATLYSNPFVFIVFNLLIVTTTAFIVYTKVPSEKDIQDYLAYKKCEDEIVQKEQEIKQIDKDIEDIKLKKSITAKYRLQLRHYQKIFYERIQAMYEQAVGEFIIANLKGRTDGKNPLCFTLPLAPLSISNEDEKIDNVLKHHNDEN